MSPAERASAGEHFYQANRAAWSDLDAFVADLAARPSEHAGTLLRLGPGASGSPRAEQLVNTLRDCPMRPSLAHPWYQRHLHALYERCAGPPVIRPAKPILRLTPHPSCMADHTGSVRCSWTRTDAGRAMERSCRCWPRLPAQYRDCAASKTRAWRALPLSLTRRLC